MDRAHAQAGPRSASFSNGFFRASSIYVAGAWLDRELDLPNTPAMSATSGPHMPLLPEITAKAINRYLMRRVFYLPAMGILTHPRSLTSLNLFSENTKNILMCRRSAGSSRVCP